MPVLMNISGQWVWSDNSIRSLMITNDTTAQQSPLLPDPEGFDTPRGHPVFGQILPDHPLGQKVPQDVRLCSRRSGLNNLVDGWQINQTID